MTKPLAKVFRCSFCPAKAVSFLALPEGWGVVGGQVACDQCAKMARVLA